MNQIKQSHLVRIATKAYSAICQLKKKRAIYKPKAMLLAKNPNKAIEFTERLASREYRGLAFIAI